MRWIMDPSSTVRWVVCCCLNDVGDLRAEAALVDRLQQDSDPQVRGVAAGGLGQIGAVEALPELYRTQQTDHEQDELGYTPAGQAVDAMTNVLKAWVLRRIPGTPPKIFREATRRGQLTGTVTAEGLEVDAEGRLTCTPRYAHLPRSAFGPGCASWLNLETSLVVPFEIDVEYADAECVIRRILIFDRITDSASFNWSVSSIVDPDAMRP